MPLIAVVFQVHASEKTLSSGFQASAAPQIKRHHSLSNKKKIATPAPKAEQVANPLASNDARIQPPSSSSMSADLLVPSPQLRSHITVGDDSDEVETDDHRASTSSPGSSAPPRLNRPAFPSWTSMAKDAARQIGSMGRGDHDHHD